ncbi:MAG TPA: PKD domain-containing protein [Candidatus Hydrogenedentes bacterium]|nr:PKD domain-containing protein [Candidatus Hydrogenedentota bacterium]
MARHAALIALVLAAAPAATAATWFVNKANASPTQNGLAWSTAFRDIQPAIDAAAKGDEIWVAGGTYGEARADETGAVLMKTGVALYGGFAGNETQRDARDWTTHLTVISGAAARGGSAAWHTIMGADDAVLDGFVITGGIASGTGDTANGGGMYNAFASPLVVHCTFTGNVANGFGGGIHNHQSSPVLFLCSIENNMAAFGAGMYNHISSPKAINCTFATNTASQSGGAVANRGACSPLYLGCTISGNAAGDGAGLENNDACTPELIRCTVNGNVASNAGGGLVARGGATVTMRHCTLSNNQAAFGGGVYCDTAVAEFSDCSFILNAAVSGAGGAVSFANAWPHVARCAFRANSALRGGALYNANGPLLLSNGVFWGNTATNGSGGAAYFEGPQTALVVNTSFSVNQAQNGGVGGAVYCATGAPCTFSNDILYGDTPSEIGGATPTVIYSDIQGGHAGTGNIQTNPQFRDAAAGDLSLLAGSPCINKGTAGNAPSNDILGTPRPQPSGGLFDMGAYEYGTAGPVADWRASPEKGMVPLAVAFADLSLPGTASPLSWLWDFGDGATSTQQNPEHTYTRGGTYTVSLTVTTPAGSHTLTRAAHIVVDGGPTADFSAAPASGSPPLSVQFTDASVAGRSPITSWAWDFGDGANSTAQSPSHTYTIAGVQTVTLTVDSATGSSTKTMIVNVGGPAAAFTADTTIGYGSLNVQFTNQSTPGTSPITGYLWNFGDSTTSTAANPDHTYSAPGFYTVSLTATSAVGSTTETKTDYIRVYRRFYVDAASTASNPNGTSWTMAYKTVQAGIDAAFAAGAPAEVWVASGTYAETRANATGSVVLKPGVDVYGGFDKSETTRSQCNPETNVTILDGTTARAGARAYHVVLGADNAILDGFTITGGWADDGIEGNGSSEDTGGGMLNYRVAPRVSRCVFTGNHAIEGGGMMNAHAAPVITACAFTGNTGNLDAGGLHNYFADAKVSECLFSSNTAAPYGGAVYNEKSAAVYTHCTFTDNQADYGGAALNYYADAVFQDCTFTGNQALCGGAVYSQHSAPVFRRCSFLNNAVPDAGGLGGALFNITLATVTLDACTLSGNTAETGAGLYNYDRSPASLVNCLLAGNVSAAAAGGMFNGGSNSTVANCTFADNRAAQGGALFNYVCPSPVTVRNSIFYNQAAQEISDIGGAATLATYSDIRGTPVFAGTGNINTNPVFTNAPNDYRLASSSPCINTGVNAGAPATDLAGTPRPQGSRVDMGAFEYFVAPVAAFTANVLSGPQPLTVQFTDQSSAGTSPIVSWRWDFGDGSPAGTSANPSHVYTDGGKYTVSLTVTTSAGSHTLIKTDYINVSSGPTANFSASPLAGLAPLAVAFQNLSVAGGSPIVGYLWDFGDGTTSTQPNPSHTFAAGLFTVSLTVTAQNGAQDTRTNPGYIVADAVPTASFDWTPASGYAPLSVAFTDTSSPGTKPITAWLWDFGDGTTSAQQNPSHTYTTAGTFTVSLTVTSDAGSNTRTQPSTVSVQPGVAPGAAFSGAPLTGSRPLVVQFTDESAPGTSPIGQWLWNFGDGTTSTEQNPMHTYDATGDFTVSLTVTSAAGNSTETRTGYVHVEPGILPMAAFSAAPTSGFRPLTVQFTDESMEGTKTITQWAWTFGDGGTSAQPNPSHTYATPGDFDVSLTVTSSVGSDTLTKIRLIHVGSLVYVDKDNTSGTENGASWGTAYRKIQDGVNAASALGGAEVWVAEGLYNEARSNSSGALIMAEGVHLYGGFAGSETARAERDWTIRKTTIDGTTSRNGNRAYHVIIGANNATLDGFTVTGGNAGNTGNGRDRGAGLYNVGVSPTVIHCTFRDMTANYGGAAIYNDSCAPSIRACRFINNMAVGGSFSQGRGGAIANISATPSIANCIFTNNFARASLVAAGQGGAVYNASGAPSIVNCTFNGNASENAFASQGQGGAVFNYQSDAMVKNSILWQDAPDEIQNQNGAPRIDYNDVSGGYPSGTGNINTDPLFTDAGNNDFSLRPESPCIDKAASEGAPNDDYRGIPRPQGLSADMGAFEYWAPPVADFIAAPADGYAPLDVAFTDVSDPGTSPITTWTWDFGDGESSAAQNPVHRYNTAGTYSVTLTVATDIASDTITKTNGITVAQAIAPQPDFEADTPGGVAPLTVQFTDRSVPGTLPIQEWNWDFGDGGTGTGPSPVHLFTLPGVYTVSLTVSTLIHTVTTIKTDFITVGPPIPPSPGFTFDPASGAAPLLVAFTDTSIPGSSPIDNWQWDFGDGETIQGLPNPSHTYLNPGVYTVSLTVVSESGSPTWIVNDAIHVTPATTLPGGGWEAALLLMGLLALAGRSARIRQTRNRQ